MSDTVRNKGFYNMLTCRACKVDWCETNLTIRADEVCCPKCGGHDIYISEHALKPTLQDAINEDAVYEWPDGTWCYKSELHEMTHMSDDYALVWYDKEKHI